MRGDPLYAIAALALAAFASVVWAGVDGMQDEEASLPSSLEVPFAESGHLATIWSWGRHRPDGDRALVLTDHGESRRIGVSAPSRVRWRSPNELLVEQFVSPIRDGSGTRILRVSPCGEVLKVLSDRGGLGGVEPSPGGDRVLLERDDRQGFRGIEVRSLEEDFRLETFHPRSPGLDSGSFGNMVWRPDGSLFAVGLWVPSPPRDPTRMSPRLAIASPDAPGFTRINDELPAGIADAEERWAVIPLFWNADGIYARGSRGLLRCDPDGSGCTVVYEPGEHRAVLSGSLTGDRKALLLVRDVSLDPLETRAKEIHQVSLDTGEGYVLLRLPEGVFISDLDWIADAGD
jgi:hypothetical protein